MVGREPSFQPRLEDNDLVVYRFHFFLWQHIPLTILFFFIGNQHIKQVVKSNCKKKVYVYKKLEDAKNYSNSQFNCIGMFMFSRKFEYTVKERSTLLQSVNFRI